MLTQAKSQESKHPARISLVAVMTLLLCLSTLCACASAPQERREGEQEAQVEAEGTDSSADSSAEASAEVPEEAATTTPEQPADFPSWNAESESLQALVSFVSEATDETSPNYIAPEDRIATFDMDGTLLCEKDPIYVDYCLLMYRVLEDPSYQADAQAIKLCEDLRANADEGIVDSVLDAAKNRTIARVFEGMEPEEFRAYVNEFLDTQEVQGFTGMTYGETLYKPMIEVVDYLRANDFDVYIVTACEREVARAIAQDRLGIEPSHVVGSDWGMSATGQGGQDADEYTFEQDDTLAIDGDLLSNCAKANKVVYIQREIGKIPVLAFGNSSGDFAMLNYAEANPDHPGMGFLVVADDVEREYGDEEKAATMREEIANADWTGISMRDDWATIYGDGVTKTQLPKEEELQKDEEPSDEGNEGKLPEAA